MVILITQGNPSVGVTLTGLICFFIVASTLNFISRI